MHACAGAWMQIVCTAAVGRGPCGVPANAVVQTLYIDFLHGGTMAVVGPGERMTGYPRPRRPSSLWQEAGCGNAVM